MKHADQKRDPTNTFIDAVRLKNHLIPITKKPILTVSYTDFIKIGNKEICLLKPIHW
jgi:hypothetical protein